MSQLSFVNFKITHTNLDSIRSEFNNYLVIISENQELIQMLALVHGLNHLTGLSTFYSQNRFPHEYVNYFKHECGNFQLMDFKSTKPIGNWSVKSIQPITEGELEAFKINALNLNITFKTESEIMSEMVVNLWQQIHLCSGERKKRNPVMVQYHSHAIAKQENYPVLLRVFLDKALLLANTMAHLKPIDSKFELKENQLNSLYPLAEDERLGCSICENVIHNKLIYKSPNFSPLNAFNFCSEKCFNDSKSTKASNMAINDFFKFKFNSVEERVLRQDQIQNMVVTQLVDFGYTQDEAEKLYPDLIFL